MICVSVVDVYEDNERRLSVVVERSERSERGE
jgi:hypothetical protein